MLRLLTVFSVVLLLFTFAGSALAQGLKVCGFFGYVTIDGEGVDNGTAIKAWIDGKKVAETTTPCTLANCNYDYHLNVEGDYEGKSIVFTIGSDNREAGSATWVVGGHSRLDLAADTEDDPYVPPATLPDPSITLYPTEGIATQVSGVGFTPGSSVSITVGGQPAGSIIANTNSTFSIVIAATDQNPGAFIVSVTDTAGRSAQATLTVPDISGDPGADGAKGAKGDPGEAGPKGDSGGSGMALAALILSVIAILGVVLVVLRISTYWKRR